MRRGALHAIIGPNGAGKTTLFNLITGIVQPDSGRVTLEGHDLTSVAPWRIVKRGVGRSFQQANLFWGLTSAENATVPIAAAHGETRRIWAPSSAESRRRADQLLNRVGLGTRGASLASDLSHGDQRSLELAASLGVESKVLLLDEPTAGLTPDETKVAVAALREIAEEASLTVLFIEHDMDVVFGVADFISVLHEGKVLAEGPPAAIRSSREVRAAYLGDEEGDEEFG